MLILLQTVLSTASAVGLTVSRDCNNESCPHAAMTSIAAY